MKILYYKDMDYTKEITINQDTENVEEVDTDSRKALARKTLVRKNAKARKNAEEREQDEEFLNAKEFYEKNTLFVKLLFNNYFSFLKREEYIKKSDAEEFLK